MKLELLFEKLGVAYDYSAVLCTVPESIGNIVKKWGLEHISDDKVFEDNEGKLGREDDTHITVKYGLHDPKETDCVDILKYQRPFEVELGKISLFKNNPRFDVVKVEIFSSNLFMLNAKLSKLPNTDSYPEYKPHMTIAYVKRGSCDDLEGREDFKDIRFLANDFIFSSRENFKIKITLR